MSKDWIEKSGATTVISDDQFTVTLADGRQHTLKRIYTPFLTLNLHGLTRQESLAVVPLQTYDVILGNQ